MLSIHITSYVTELPSIDVMRKKLHKSIEKAQLMLEQREPDPNVSTRDITQEIN